MEDGIRNFFVGYARVFNQALAGDIGMDEVSNMYAAEFIAATPAGVKAGMNGEQLREAMKAGYARYREMGMKVMQLLAVRPIGLDEHHYVARVRWKAIYGRRHGPDANVEFDVHYFLQMGERGPKVFGWVAGDEEALLREHGIT